MRDSTKALTSPSTSGSRTPRSPRRRPAPGCRTGCRLRAGVGQGGGWRHAQASGRRNWVGVTVRSRAKKSSCDARVFQAAGTAHVCQCLLSRWATRRRGLVTTDPRSHMPRVLHTRRTPRSWPNKERNLRKPRITRPRSLNRSYRLCSPLYCPVKPQWLATLTMRTGCPFSWLWSRLWSQSDGGRKAHG